MSYKLLFSILSIICGIPSLWFVFKVGFIKELKIQMHPKNRSGSGDYQINPIYRQLARIFLGKKEREWDFYLFDPGYHNKPKFLKDDKTLTIRLLIFSLLAIMFLFISLIIK